MPDGLLPDFPTDALATTTPATTAVVPAPAAAPVKAAFDQESLYHADRQAYSRNFAAMIGTVLVVIFLCGLTLWLPLQAAKPVASSSYWDNSS